MVKCLIQVHQKEIAILNIFKREIKILLRNPIVIFAGSIGVFLSSLTFKNDYTDIKFFYSIFPYYLSLFVPVMSLSIWNRDVKLGLLSHYKLAKIPIFKIILEKFLVHLLFYCAILILHLPIVGVLSLITTVDPGQILSINIGLILYILIILSITTLFSTLIRTRVLSTFFCIIIGLLLWFLLPIFNTFYDGYMDFSLLLFIVSLSLLVLIISSLTISTKIKKHLVVIPIVILVFSIVLPLGLDLTTQKYFSLRPYTKKVISNLEGQLEIELYLSTIDDTNLTNKVLILINSLRKLNNISVSIAASNTDRFKNAVLEYKPNNKDSSFLVVKYNNFYQVIPSVPNFAFLQFEIVKVIEFLVNGGLNRVGIYIGNEDLTEDNFTYLQKTLMEDFLYRVFTSRRCYFREYRYANCYWSLRYKRLLCRGNWSLYCRWWKRNFCCKWYSYR